MPATVLVDTVPCVVPDCHGAAGRKSRRCRRHKGTRCAKCRQRGMAFPSGHCYVCESESEAIAAAAPYWEAIEAEQRARDLSRVQSLLDFPQDLGPRQVRHLAHAVYLRSQCRDLVAAAEKLCNSIDWRAEALPELKRQEACKIGAQFLREVGR